MSAVTVNGSTFKYDNPPFNTPDIRNKVYNFRKLMIMFPFVHPAAIHGLLVKYDYNFNFVMDLLLGGHDERAKQYWNMKKEVQTEEKNESNFHNENEVVSKRKGRRYIKRSKTVLPGETQHAGQASK